MSDWLYIPVDPTLIAARSEKAIKIKFPCECAYCDYTFWISKKLYKDDYFVLGNNFEIKASKFKYENKNYVLEDELVFSAKEIDRYFSKYVNSFVQRIVEIVPNPIEPIKNPQPLEELLR